MRLLSSATCPFIHLHDFTRWAESYGDHSLLHYSWVHESYFVMLCLPTLSFSTNPRRMKSQDTICVVVPISVMCGHVHVLRMSRDLAHQKQILGCSQWCISKLFHGCVSAAGEEGEDGVERTCDTLLMCIVTVLNQGLRNGGGVGDVLRRPSKDVSKMGFALRST